MQKPIIYNEVNELPNEVRITDAYESAIKELFTVENPSLRKDDPNRQQLLAEYIEKYTGSARYVYYPWLNHAVKTVDEQAYYKLRTARNRVIIQDEEQQNFRVSKVGVVGLSVGSSAVRAIVASGGSKFLKIADFDELEITNLNRISAGLPNVGENKTHILAKYIFEMDPDAQLELWDKGVDKESLERFILDPKLDVFVDEMDNLVLKFLAREICRTHKIPVLMATDNGDSVVLDIERFDLEPERDLFHGLVNDIDLDAISNLPFYEWVKVATRIVGPDQLTSRMQEAVMNIGRTIAGVPQLGTTATLAGSAIAFAIRKIANKEDLPSGRYAFGLDSVLIPGYNESSQVQKRQEVAQLMIQAFTKK